MKIQLPSKMTRAFGTAGLKLKKHSPELLVAGGIVGGITAAVMACKATTKLDAVLEAHHEKMEALNDVKEHPEMMAEPYTEEDHKKCVTLAYAQTGVELFKLYAPAVGVGVLSITAILAGHNVLRKRNVALAAAYTAIDKSFKEYRGRVVERFGEALDKELRYNIKSKEVEEIVQNEDGSQAVVKTHVDVVDPTTISEYARIYDDGCKGWSKDPEYNLMFLKQQERYLNDRLKAVGWVTLNEAYEALGFPRTSYGQVVGWVYDEVHPNGDNFIDFGIFNVDDPKKRDFVNGYERNVIIDFNVDGPILDLI